jgi:hypothetical protein
MLGTGMAKVLGGERPSPGSQTTSDRHYFTTISPQQRKKSYRLLLFQVPIAEL